MGRVGFGRGGSIHIYGLTACLNYDGLAARQNPSRVKYACKFTIPPPGCVVSRLTMVSPAGLCGGHSMVSTARPLLAEI